MDHLLSSVPLYYRGRLWCVVDIRRGIFSYRRSANSAKSNTMASMPADANQGASGQAPLFEVRDLHVSVQGTEILRGVDLVVPDGELHALMGPNGSGKSTLAKSLLGAPGYDVTRGQILYKGEDITGWPPETRGKAGMFLAFQYPEEIPGVPLVQFLRQALSARKRGGLVRARAPLERHGLDAQARYGLVFRRPLP